LQTSQVDPFKQDLQALIQVPQEYLSILYRLTGLQNKRGLVVSGTK